MSQNESTSSKSPGALLLEVNEVAELLSCSQRTVQRLADSGKMPRPIKLGRLVRWNKGELELWIEAGCPAIRQFKASRI